MDAPISENTKETYRNALSCFKAFRREYSLAQVCPLPFSIITYSHFHCISFIKQKSHKTVTTYLSAINYRCKSCSFEDFSENVLVRKMIEGMRRLNKQNDTRLPISQGLLLKLINALPYICSSIFEATLFSSAFSLAFHGFLRVGELVLSKRRQAHQVINIKDISIANENDVEKI